MEGWSGDSESGHQIIVPVPNFTRSAAPTFHTRHAGDFQQGSGYLASVVGLAKIDGYISHKVFHQLIRDVAHRIPHIEDRNKNGSGHCQCEDGQEQASAFAECVAQ